jgi:hypothetical protein
VDLTLAVKREYFEQIQSGEKTEEYRLLNEYWQKKLRQKYWTNGYPELKEEFFDKKFDRAIITLGYPKKTMYLAA